jgi:hypothetical protein
LLLALIGAEEPPERALKAGQAPVAVWRRGKLD